MELALIIVLGNWIGSLLLTWLYVGTLLLTKDVSFEGWIFWRGWYPIARFRLISKHSWFAKIWSKFYGHALFGAIIHRDEEGPWDDLFVVDTIVHELRHCFQQLLGLVFYLLYGLDYVRLVAMGKDGYYNNWFERDARQAVRNWVDAGRPKRFKFGKRY
ncbi:hypothetical protein LCGC14_1165230 [marine sediment metagenome]|uniref:DUF4157 domain-containing protein n=1 Tax=marine sediment metagenome TaxID=412755 RepID=A0A0F9P9L0_9ZZZZ